ncbi:LCP family protein [Arthrobacter sp. B2a2-09]|uniref:LCP family protein n=1 Tax=Arthrobacter sp. B2a2-09 TaxID=2952822 RepID=UPI0022CD4879|nr:LCP family protein [Arthrobacter sp. B2a2-09]MCZ9884235.1 LCP family protein [Arthrobacter sp. B2a2-09]
MDRRRRLWLAAGLAVLLAIVVVLAAIVAGSGRTSSGSSPSSASAGASATRTPSPAKSPAPTAAAPAPPTIPELPATPMNILVIGSDSRANARDQNNQTVTTGQSSDQRSDCLMLIHVPADRQKVYGISIMRDNWVNIPGYGAAKINASLEVGGIPLVVQTVETLLGTHIDHTVMLDFQGFKVLTDALGGIDVNVTLPFTADFDTHHVFVAGVNHLDGEAALEFVRERYAFVDGDYQRVRNQQTFLHALLTKLRGGIQTPAAVLGLVNFATNYLTVDQGYDPAAVAILAYALRTVDPGASVFFTLPTAGTGTSADGQSIVVPDYAGIGQVAAALRDGTLPEYVAAHGY